MSLTIYPNNECSKCKGALELLQEKNIPHTIRWYQVDPLSTDELKELLNKLQLHAFDLVRQNETLYKEQYLDKNLTEDEWIRVLIENPSLMQRPIVVNGDKAIIARPPEKLLALL